MKLEEKLTLIGEKIDKLTKFEKSMIWGWVDDLEERILENEDPLRKILYIAALNLYLTSGGKFMEEELMEELSDVLERKNLKI